MANGRFIDYQGVSGANFYSPAYGVGDLEDLFVHLDASLSSTDASQPVATINVWTSTKDGSGGQSFYSQNKPMQADQYRRKIFTTTLNGAAGGAATAESIDFWIGNHAPGANQVFFGSYILVEVLMSANASMASGHFDIQGK